MMNKETAMIIAEIGGIVRNHWPEVTRKERLHVIKETLDHPKSFILADVDEFGIRDPENFLQIRLSIDGTLSVFNTDPETEVETITIELLTTRTIRKTITYDIEV